jgi:hypothetical protein
VKKTEEVKELTEILEGKVVDLVSVPHRIHFDPELMAKESNLGVIYHYRNEIHIEYSLKPRDLLTTLLHEFLESINKRYELKLPHQKIQMLEAGIFQIMMSNPTIMQEFVNEGRKSTSEEETKSGTDGKEKAVGRVVKGGTRTCRREMRMVRSRKIRTGTSHCR